MRRVTRPADTLRMVLTDISKDASDTWWMPVGWMMCTIRHTNLLKIKRAYSFQAGDVDPILARVGATLVVGINTALRAEIMFCRAGVKLISRQVLSARKNSNSIYICRHRDGTPHPAKRTVTATCCMQTLCQPDVETDGTAVTCAVNILDVTIHRHSQSKFLAGDIWPARRACQAQQS